VSKGTDTTSFCFLWNVALTFPTQSSQLRGSEESKIECARRHFKAISDNGYIYDVAKDYKSLYDIVTK
jgi:restriction endonuclease